MGDRPRPAVRSGAKRWLTVTVGPVGHDVAGHAALDPHGLQRLAELAAVEHRPARLVGVERGEQRAEAVDGVGAHPRPGGVGPLAGERDVEPQRALAAGLDGAVGRLAEDGGVAGQQVGPLGEEVPNPLCTASTSSQA